MPRALLPFLLSFLLFAGCEKSNSFPICSENGDYTVDVLPAGDAFLPITAWYYLSDEAGNIQDERNASGFPLFFNWPDHCADSYTLNYANRDQFTTPVIVNGGGGMQTITHTSAQSFFGLPNGLSFRGGLKTLRLSSQTGVPVRSISFEGIPDLDSMFVANNSSVELSYSVAEHRLVVTTMTTTSSVRSYPHAIIGIRLAGESAFRAVIVDLLDEIFTQGTLADFSVPLEKRSLLFPDTEATHLELSMIVDEEARETLSLANGTIVHDRASAWVPLLDRPFVLGYGTPTIPEGWYHQEVYAELPMTFTYRPDLIRRVARADGGFRVDLRQAAYLELSTGFPIFPISPDEWKISGPLPGGESLVNIPPISLGFQEQYPEMDLRSWWESNSSIPTATAYYYPAVATPRDYWNSRDLPWRDQLTYDYVTLKIE